MSITMTVEQYKEAMINREVSFAYANDLQVYADCDHSDPADNYYYARSDMQAIVVNDICFPDLDNIAIAFEFNAGVSFCKQFAQNGDVVNCYETYILDNFDNLSAMVSEEESFIAELALSNIVVVDEHGDFIEADELFEIFVRDLHKDELVYPSEKFGKIGEKQVELINEAEADYDAERA